MAPVLADALLAKKISTINWCARSAAWIFVTRHYLRCGRAAVDLVNLVMVKVSKAISPFLSSSTSLLRGGDVDNKL